jgi:hypothetical protein
MHFSEKKLSWLHNSISTRQPNHMHVAESKLNYTPIIEQRHGLITRLEARKIKMTPIL